MHRKIPEQKHDLRCTSTNNSLTVRESKGGRNYGKSFIQIEVLKVGSEEGHVDSTVFYAGESHEKK